MTLFIGETKGKYYRIIHFNFMFCRKLFRNIAFSQSDINNR